MSDSIDPKYAKLFPNATAQIQREREPSGARSGGASPVAATTEERRSRMFPNATADSRPGASSRAPTGVDERRSKMFPAATGEQRGAAVTEGSRSAQDRRALEAAPGDESPLAAESRQIAAELGLDGAAAEKVLEYYRRTGKERVESWQREREANHTQLRQDPEITAGLPALREAVRLHGGDEFLQALGEAGDNPVVVRTLVRLAMAAQRRGGR